MSDVTDSPSGPELVPIPLGLPLQGPDISVDAQMLMALGSVVRTHSMLDYTLRMLFCALTDSKYAAITSAGQTTGWLVDSCMRLVARRDGLTEGQRDDLCELLKRTRAAAEERNRLVHDVWAVGIEIGQLMRSNRKTYELSFVPVTLERLLTAQGDLGSRSESIAVWVETSLGPAAVDLETQLRWEDFKNGLPGYEN